MSTKTVCVHRYVIPPLKQFQKKYYFLVTSLLFEYESNGYYRDDLEVFGFNEEESSLLCEIFPFFDPWDQAIKVEGFDLSILESMISILPEDEKKLLIDHIVLSSIDKSSDVQKLFLNLETTFYNVGESLLVEYLSELDYETFFIGGESSFMNEYYPSKDSKDEIRMRYSLKYRG